MAISFEKLIADVQSYNDGLELPITIGEGDKATTERIRLGDVRGQLSNTLARYEAALQTERENRSALEQTLKSLKEAAPDRAAPTGDRREVTPPAGAPTEDDLNSDPWSRALLARAEKLFSDRINSALGPLKGEHDSFVDTSKKGVGALTTLVLRTIANQDYGRFSDWPKDYDPSKAFKEAGDRGYIDKATGLPDLARLHHDLTEDARIEARAEKRAEEMFAAAKKAESEKNQSRFNKLHVPGGVRAKAEKKAPQYRNLQEYMMSDDALPTDDEIRGMGGLLNSIR
jgi:hypothetical protein